MFCELTITSNFTFLTGASHPEEYMNRAALLGIEAIVIADDNSVAGIVRAHTEARKIAIAVKERQDFDAIWGLIGPPLPNHLLKSSCVSIVTTPRLIPGARLIFSDAPPITVLPQDRDGWRSLCRIISRGRLKAKKGVCSLQLSDLEEFKNGLNLLIWPQVQIVEDCPVDWQQIAQRLMRLL